ASVSLDALLRAVPRLTLFVVRGYLAHPRYRGLQVRFRVDEKLARDDDGVAGANTVGDLRLAIAFDARFDIDRREPPRALRDDDDGAFARPNNRFTRHEHGISATRRRKIDRREHARDETAVGIGELNARLERPRGRIDLGQDRVHASLEYGARERNRARFDGVARTNVASSAFRHFGVHPHRRNTIETK